MLGALDDKIAVNLARETLSDELIRTAFDRATRNAPLRPLFDVVDVDFGEPFKGTAFSGKGEGRPLIRIRDLKTFTPQTWTTEQRPRESWIEPGQVVVGMDAEFRATWWLGDPGLLNQRVCRMRGKRFGPAYAAEALRRPLAAIENEKTGTTVIHLNKADLARSTIACASQPELERFETMAEPVLASRVSAARERTVLARTRDELLPLLMSGRVRVKDAEKVVEGVV